MQLLNKIFCALWFLFFLLSYKSYLKYDFNYITPLCFFIFFVVFLITSYLLSKINYKFNKLNYIFNKNYIYPIILLYFIILFFILIRVFYIAIENNFEFINNRHLFYSANKLFDNKLIYYLYPSILYLKSILFVFLLFFIFLCTKYKNYKLLFLSTIALIVDTVIFSSRLNIILIMLCIFISFYYFNILSKKNFLTLGFIFSIFSITLLAIRLNDTTYQYAILNYFEISPLLFNHTVSEYKNSFQYNSVGLNVLFSGFEYFIALCLRLFDQSYVNIGYEWVNLVSRNTCIVSEYIITDFFCYNFYYSFLLEPYLFAGLFGISFLAFLFALLLHFFTLNFVNYKCELSLLIIIYISIILVTGFFGSIFTTVSFYFFVFIIIFLSSYLFKN